MHIIPIAHIYIYKELYLSASPYICLHVEVYVFCY